MMPSQLISVRQRLISPIVLAFVLYNLLSFATLLLEVPLVRLFEKSICNRYYRQHPPNTIVALQDVDEALCKIAPVQNLLATVVGWELSFGAIPGLLTAISYGYLAEKRGRRLVLFLSVLGHVGMLAWVVMICAYDTIFKVQLAWVSAAFFFIGGGTRVFNSLVFATVSDSLAHSRRTKYLYFLHAGPHINRLITPRISAALMERTLFAPFIVSFALLGASLVVVCFIDEHCGKDESQVQYKSVPSEEPTSITVADEHTLPSRLSESDTAEFLHPTQSHISNKTSRDSFHELPKRIARLFSTSAARFCLVAFFLKRVAFTSEGFMFQYASEKFGWKLQQTTWLRVFAAIGAIFTTLIACPSLAYYLSTSGYKAAYVNIWIIRVCLVILIVGFLNAFFANSGAFLFIAMLFAGLGEGMEPALQGLITYLTNSSANTQLFTVLALVDTIAEFTGGPLTASLMAIGRSEEPKHASDGWCFLASSIMFAFLAAWSIGVSAKRRRTVTPELEERGNEDEG